MLKRFTRYVTQSVAGMIGISVYVLADTFFISVYSGADGLAILNRFLCLIIHLQHLREMTVHHQLR